MSSSEIKQNTHYDIEILVAHNNKCLLEFIKALINKHDTDGNLSLISSFGLDAFSSHLTKPGPEIMINFITKTEKYWNSIHEGKFNELKEITKQMLSTKQNQLASGMTALLIGILDKLNDEDKEELLEKFSANIKLCIKYIDMVTIVDEYIKEHQHEDDNLYVSEDLKDIDAKAHRKKWGIRKLKAETYIQIYKKA